MPEEYFIERLRAQEDEIRSLRATFEAARRRGNKKLMGISRKRLELALHLREMYRRMLKREGTSTGTA
jgi:predicted  nucleic acid-binding Zn-ribbon protein